MFRFDPNDPRSVATLAAPQNGSNCSTAFVGNWVQGEHNGVSGFEDYTDPVPPGSISVCGNYFDLVLPGWDTNNLPQAAVEPFLCPNLNVSGNTMHSGGSAVIFGGECDSALIHLNDFSAATYQGIGQAGSGTPPYWPWMAAATISSNIINQGNTFDAAFAGTNSFGWFFYHNTFTNSSAGVVLPFFDPAQSSIHVGN